jgi:hypothetical protein
VQRLEGHIGEMHRGIATVLHVTSPPCCHPSPRARRARRKPC